MGQVEIVCCVCSDEAAQALETPIAEAFSVLQDESPLKRTDSQNTILPSR